MLVKLAKYFLHLHTEYSFCVEPIIKDQNIQHPERSILTIYTGPDKFSFSLYDATEKGSFFHADFTDENQTDAFSVFKKVFFEQTFLSMPFQKVRIMNRTPNFTFIPHSYYKDRYQEKYLRFLFSDRQGIPMTCSVPSASITVLYQLPKTVHDFMIRSFTNPEFIHYSAPLITYFLEKANNMDVHRMVINLQENGLDIFCFLGKSFLFGNYFSCNSIEDMLYYIFFTWKQLELDQKNDYLHIAGNIALKEEIIDRLTPYIKNTYSLSISPEIHFEGIVTNAIPFELAALSICEL